jgi:hypothetical protein
LNAKNELLKFDLLMQENEQRLKNHELSQEQFEKIKAMQEAYKQEIFLDEDGVFNETAIGADVFIMFYSNSFKNAEESLEKIRRLLPKTMSSVALDYYEITNLIKKMINP